MRPKRRIVRKGLFTGGDWGDEFEVVFEKTDAPKKTDVGPDYTPRQKPLTRRERMVAKMDADDAAAERHAEHLRRQREKDWDKIPADRKGHPLLFSVNAPPSSPTSCGG